MAENSKIVLLVALGFLLAMLTVFKGCGGYGEVGPGAYEHAKALYSICNRQDASRLEIFSTSLTAAREAGEVTAREQEWLEDIAAMAQAGDWQDATAKARRLMEDQVQGGP
jgi:hypothetical protein